MAARPVQASLSLGAVRSTKDAARGPQSAETDPAMVKAGRILSRRPHSTRELRDKLWASGIAQEDIDRAVDRLTELKLLDDEDFARLWVEERARTKGLAPAALLKELADKGIESDLAERVVGELGFDEEAEARELAIAYLKRVSGKAPLVQARRIQAMLLRKGFSMEAAVAGARAALPPEGWD
jgi:regulatory protein